MHSGPLLQGSGLWVCGFVGDWVPHIRIVAAYNAQIGIFLYNFFFYSNKATVSSHSPQFKIQLSSETKLFENSMNLVEMISLEVILSCLLIEIIDFLEKFSVSIFVANIYSNFSYCLIYHTCRSQFLNRI